MRGLYTQTKLNKEQAVYLESWHEQKGVASNIRYSKAAIHACQHFRDGGARHG